MFLKNYIFNKKIQYKSSPFTLLNLFLGRKCLIIPPNNNQLANKTTRRKIIDLKEKREEAQKKEEKGKKEREGERRGNPSASNRGNNERAFSTSR